MKVINPGDPEAGKPWWQKVTIECVKCRWAIGEFTDNDVVERRFGLQVVDRDDQRDSVRYIEATCPNCKVPVRVHNGRRR